MDRIITLCYRKIIDARSGKPWDKLVFEDTYAEFRLQAQNVNPNQTYRTFGQLLHHVPEAGQLPFLVSSVVRSYLPQLGGLVPDILDNLGRRFLRFSRFQFEIINSDLTDQAHHQVAISFYSELLTWHETIGTQLLVSERAASEAGGEVPTHLVPLQPYLSIHTLQPAS